MSISDTIILGIIQGLTEFLPVSSSGHLTLAQAIMGLDEVPILYDIILHTGTLVAVFVVLWQEVVDILSHPIRYRLGMLIAATLPAAAVTILADYFAKDAFREILDGKYLAFGFFATSAILVASELLARRTELKRNIRLPEALVMGGMQAAALFPGVSRSGSTISGGLFMGVKREAAARYAFLMSIPVILGSIVFGAKDVMENGMGDVSVVSMLIGFVVAALSGFGAIKFMLALINRHKLYGFAVYTAVAGLFVLYLSGNNPGMF